MADEIKQELGFTADKAIQTLRTLDKAMEDVGKQFGRSVKAMGQFNQEGGRTVGLLKRLATDADKAAKALARVATLSAAAGKAPAGPTGSTAAVPAVDQYIQMLNQMYTISATATEAQKRAFQSAITGAAEYAVKNKIAMQDVTAQSQNLDKNFTGVANRMADNLSKIDKAAKRHLNEAGLATRKLTIDFATMVRVVTTQAIVRALSAIRNVLRGAVKDAIQFQTAVSEIATIAPTNDLRDLAARVREISDAFNAPLDTTSRAYYQTISNQIGNTVEDYDRFMKAAAKFSKTSVTDLKSAVDLGSGTLNAFGKSAQDAEEVFGKFFVTIKQGRVVGSELAQGYGTVAKISAMLGVEIDELNAAIATTTIQGVAADKAFTQLRGVFNAFLKPTPEMIKAMKELGFETGEQILKAYDLQTALRLVVGQTDGTSRGIAKLIPNIRGFTGGLSLLNDKAGHFTKTLEMQREMLDRVYGEGFSLTTDTDAHKVTKELNKLKNFMTQEFGESILATTGKMLLLVGGAEKIGLVLGAIAPVIPTMALGALSLAAALGVVAVKARLAAAGLSGMVGPIGVLAMLPAAVAAGNFLAASMVSTWDAEHKAFVKNMEEQAEARRGKIAEELAAERKKTKDLERLLARELALVRSKHYKVSELAVEENHQALDNLKFFTGQMIRERERYFQRVQQLAHDSSKQVFESEKRAANLRTNLEDKLFTAQLKRSDPVWQISGYIERAKQLADLASSSMGGATTEEQRASADEQFRRAQAFAEQAISVAATTDELVYEQKALDALKSIIESNIDAEGRFQQSVKQSQQALVKRAQNEERRVANMQAKQKELLKSYQLYDEKTGQLLSQEDRAANLRKGQKHLAEFIDLASSGQPLDVTAMMDFAKISHEMNRELSGFRIKELVATDAALKALHKQVQDSLEQFYRETPAAGLIAKDTGIGFDSNKASENAVEAYTGKLDALKNTHAIYNELLGDTEEKLLQLENALGKVAESSSNWGTLLAVGASSLSGETKALDEMSAAMELVRRALTGGAVSLEEFHLARRGLIESEKNQGSLSGILTGDLKADLVQAMNRLHEYIDLQQRMRDLSMGSETPIDLIPEKIERMEAVRKMLEQPAIDAQSMSTAVGATDVSMTNAAATANTLAAAWRSIATSAQMAATAAAGMQTPIMASTGGSMNYFASGGYARGTDTRPAMLSKGEFVVNAASSRQFFSQLSAINAGVKPVYRESGGSVTNIGDVSINVNGSQSPKQTARETMSAFRREIRRGSGRL